MRTFFRRVLAVAVLITALAGCETGETDAEGSYGFGDSYAFRLPPGHPGFVSGNILILPSHTWGPAVHAANCFAGVETDMQIGIGSAVGYTSAYVGAAILPVNISLGTRQLRRYQIHVVSGDPAIVDFDASAGAVTGSIAQLASADCLQRGCPSSCQASGLYPVEFTRAPGFEHVDTVTSGVGWITVETLNNDLVNPTTGVVNLCNIKVLIKGALPGAGVPLTFSVLALEDTGLNDISGSALPQNGLVIEHSQLQ